ncbi:MAG: hypothetical protein H5T49_05990, partial [Hadesarchaea archaeon]|nr:hypothetical protein [Hadesarchaea archaeon]
MASVISTSTVSAAPGATFSPTFARANTRIKVTVTVTNGYATDNIDNVVIKFTSQFSQPIGYHENIVLAAENMENAVPYLKYAGENLKLAEENKKSAGPDIKAAGDNLSLITQGDWLAENVTAGAGTADENAYVNVSLAASNLKLAGEAIAKSVENLEYIYEKLKAAGDYLVLASGYENAENIENINASAAENVWSAGDNIRSAAENLRQGDLENAGLKLMVAGDNLKGAGDNFSDPELKAYFQAAGEILKTAGQKLVDAGNYLDDAAYALQLAEDYLTSSGNYLENHWFLETAGANLQIAASHIENAGKVLSVNMPAAGDNLKCAADNLENVAKELGVDLGMDDISAAATDLGQAADNLINNGMVDITTAGDELISAANNLSSGAAKMKATANELQPTTWDIDTTGADYVEFDAIGDNVITPGASETFVFLITTPDINTENTYTVSVLVSKEETVYTSYEIVGTFTMTVDGEEPTLTITVTQTGVPDNNLVGNKLNNGVAKITVVASEKLQDIGQAIIENSEGTQENLLPPINLSTTDGITFTATFSVGEWDDNSCRVRITSAKDLAGNESTDMVQSFTVDTRAPIIDDGLMGIVSGARENVVQPGTGKVFRYVDNVTTKSVIVTVRDNAPGASDENTRVVSVIVNNVAMTRDPMVENRWTKTITLSEGYNAIVEVKAYDKTGNVATDNVENIFIDTKAPTIEFVSIAGKTWTDGVYINDNTPQLKLVIKDPGYPDTGLGIPRDNLKVWLDNDDNYLNDTPYWELENMAAWDYGLAGVFENLIDNALPENTYYVVVWASDNLWHAGENGTVASRKFIVDVTKPQAPTSVVGSVSTGTTPADAKPTSTSSITITGEAESKATIKVYTTTDGGVTWTEYTEGRTTAGSTWTTSVKLTGFAGKVLGIAVTATDLAGNESAKYEVGYLIYTPAPPSNLAGSLAAGATAALAKATAVSTLNLTGTATPNHTIKVYTTTDAGVTWTEYTAGKTTASATGAWTTSVQLSGFAGKTVGIAVTATDEGGNESTKTIYGYLIYDANAPSVEITSPASGTTTDQATIQITGRVTKDAWESYSNITLTLQVGTGAVEVPIGSDGTFVYSVALAEGLNTIVARATDGVNVGTPVSITVTRTVTPWST